MVISRLTTKNRRPRQNIGNFSSCKMETSFRYNSSNIKLLYGYARESFSVDEYRDCWEIARSNTPASLAEIFKLLDQHRIRRNILFKLLFHNLVETDIHQPITANSSIAAVAAKIDWRILFNG